MDSVTFSGPLIGFGLLSPQVSLVFSSKYGIFSVKSCSVANQTYVNYKIHIMPVLLNVQCQNLLNHNYFYFVACLVWMKHYLKFGFPIT